MARKTIDIKAEALFPFHFLVLAGIFLFAGLIVVANHPIMGSVLMVLAIFMLTAYEGTEVRPSSKTFREYYCFFLFLKAGKYRKYKSVEGIAIYKAKVNQKMFTASTTKSSTFSHIEYHAYLKLAGSDRIFLMSGRDKARLKQKATRVASELNTSVADHALSES